MQKLQTVNAETLLYEPLEKPSFVVDSLIPTGLSLFCGSQKIGKSWLMLKLCLCVSQGIPLWDMPTMEGDVLYLCLEDTFCRIQDRLFRLTDEASGRLHFAVASCKLSDGLIVQLEDYLKDYPDSRLIVIDTLQKVRTASKDNAYASDYGDISLIKDFADRHSLAVIVVHHIRKQNDSDVFNKVSGTTGLTGSADATFVLEKEKRASDTAKLYVTGRDTPYQEYTLRFRDCRWELVERKTQEQLAKETIPDVLFRLVDFMRDKEEWIGTATELLAAMGETETIPTVITKWLNEYRTTFLSENRICYQYTYKKEINRMVAEAGCRTRKDSVMMVETLITASPEFMNQLPPEEQKAYFQTALDFISERVGKQNILSAVVHMDERTPHMHLCFVPITPDNKLSAKAILGNQKSLSEWQTAYHERMSSRWNQLERGQSSMETKRKHVPTWLYKLGGRLDKQYEEIVSALSDINAFNAGKKRDKALDLLSAWLPDVEKFSKEIGKQQAYIDSLKERIGQESDYAGRMRDEKYEQELKVQKANQKIFELQRTNEQMGRLLSKIPPEVLEELQKNHRSRAKER
ncbi:MobV family relaxase [Streptococcus suis]